MYYISAAVPHKNCNPVIRCLRIEERVRVVFGHTPSVYSSLEYVPEGQSENLETEGLSTRGLRPHARSLLYTRACARETE